MDAKPVFPAERRLFEEICGRPLPSNLYASGNRVYYDGRFLMSLKTDNGYVAVAKNHFDTLLSDEPGTQDSFSMCAAIAANEPALRFLEQQAMDSIDHVAQVYQDRKPVVSFSGGKDSAVVAHLVMQALGIAENVSLFYADTTLEHPETNDYVRQFAEYYDLPLEIRRASSDFFQMCEQLEPPSRIMRWCCTLFKANPLNAYLREQHGLLSFDGIRRTESNRRRNYEKISGNKKALTQLVFRPILDWSSLAVWLYIFTHDIPYNPAYDKGYARVGCVICPFSTDFNDFLTRRYYPDRVQSWESMLKRYFADEYADRYDSEQAAHWIRQGLWKARKPHRKNQIAAVRVSTCPTLNEYAYQLECCVDDAFLDYLKPLGELTVSLETGFFRVCGKDNFFITGKLGGDLLNVSLIGTKPRSDMFMVERQLKKAMNCVKCGACVGMCPCAAIEVRHGVSFSIDEQKCTHCLACVRAKFTHYGCVAVSYKGTRNWIEEA